MLDIPVSCRISWAVLDHGKLKTKDHCLSLEQVDSRIEIPPSAFASLLIEPGVSVTHEAVKLCAENNTLLIWIGEGGTRIYSVGQFTSNPKRLISQASLHLDNKRRIEAAKRLYGLMFEKSMPPSFTIEKLRGIEGARVKAWYEKTASDLGFVWTGKLTAGDLQQTMAFATGCLYSVAEIAIHVLGYSPSIGIVHSGDAKSMVYDLADTLKFNGFLQQVMQEHVSMGMSDYASTRRFCRDYFRSHNTLQTAIDNMEHIFDGSDRPHFG